MYAFMYVLTSKAFHILRGDYGLHLESLAIDNHHSAEESGNWNLREYKTLQI